jgi:hypothetical protein
MRMAEPPLVTAGLAVERPGNDELFSPLPVGERSNSECSEGIRVRGLRPFNTFSPGSPPGRGYVWRTDAPPVFFADSTARRGRGVKIFISYNSKDRTWAQWIGVPLRDNGHVPFVHEWEIGAGQNIPHWMNEKLKVADRLLGVFTDAYTKAIYSGAERDAAFWEDPEGREGFLVPVEVETVTDWPPLVKPLKRLSLVDLNETEAETALLDFLKPPKPPDKRPPFPASMSSLTRGSTSTACRNQRARQPRSPRKASLCRTRARRCRKAIVRSSAKMSKSYGLRRHNRLSRCDK